MKRLSAAALVALALILTGCGVPKDDLETVVELRDECEEAGGIFHTWVVAETNQYGYECDLSTNPDEKR